MKTISDRLKYARKKAGISQQDLARQAGCSQSTIGNIEAGTRERPREILSISTALGVNPEWLERGTGAETGATPPAMEWPFEMISREQWLSLTERQKGIVEAAARTALLTLPNLR